MVDIRPYILSGIETSNPALPPLQTGAPATLAPNSESETATPHADGSVVHIVGYGQTLWSIAVAYQVSLDDLRRLNSMPADSADIYEGQALIIRAPSDNPTATPPPPEEGSVGTTMSRGQPRRLPPPPRPSPHWRPALPPPR